jgi:superfamily II DNA or RNA helicase
MITLRQYQQECVDSILSKRAGGITRPLVSMATGLGKTLVFAALAKEMNVRTLIIAHRDELIRQAKEKLLLIWPEMEPNIGIVKGDLHEPNRQIVIASIQSAIRDGRLRDLKDYGFDLCIIDEAHHAAAPTYEGIARELGFLNDDPSKMLLGVTATPKRGDGIGLSSIFQEIVFNRGLAWGIRAGYLSPLVGCRISTKISLKGVQTQVGDFVASQLSRTINVPGRNRLIVESYLKYGNARRKTIAFCADVQHAEDLSAMFQEAGVSSMAIHGRMDIEDRRGVLSQFENGDLRVITNCAVLTEGFDSPLVDSILLCRPTKSEALYVQSIGRGTRVSPGKKNCLVIDFVDASRHNLCSFQNSLEGVVSIYRNDDMREEEPKPIEALEAGQDNASFEASGVQEIDFFGRSQFSWIQVGDAWHLPVSEKRDIWVRKSSSGYRAVLHENGLATSLPAQGLPLDYAVGAAEDWVRTQAENFLARKDAKWRTDPPSEKQIAALERFGIRDPNLTKGGASDLLRIKFNEKIGAAHGRSRI